MSYSNFKGNHLFFKISQYRFPNAAVTVAVSITYAITYGCATIPTTAPPSPQIREQLGRIGIVPLSSPIQGKFYTSWSKGKGTGALYGATLGAAAGASAFLLYPILNAGTFVSPGAIVAAASGPYAPFAFILLGIGALAVLYGTGKGAAYGEAAAVPAETAKQIEQQIDDFLADMKLSSGLAEVVYAAGASKRSLAKNAITLLEEVNFEPNNSYDIFFGQGIKTILEVSVTEIGFQEMHKPPPDLSVGEQSEDHPIKFYMNARTRLVEAANDTILYTRNFHYAGSYQPLTAWLETGGQGLELEFKQAQANLADRIIHELFLANAMDVASTEKEHKIATDAPPAEKENPNLASIPKDVATSPIALRRQPMAISSETQITKMLKKFSFFERSKNSEGSFNNHLVDNKDGTVTDYATRLMWQKGGTSNSLENKEAKKYIDDLNAERFAGYSDWRMPTIEELASLLTRKRENGVYLDPVFSNRQVACWTVDERDPGHPAYLGAWVIDFKQGQIVKSFWLKFGQGGPSGSMGRPGQRYLNHVKAVR